MTGPTNLGEGNRLRVLLIDENPDFLRAATGFLQRQGALVNLQTAQLILRSSAGAAENLHGNVVFRSDYPGAAIGLVLCHKIVELHGGRIRVGSGPDKDSAGYFTTQVADLTPMIRTISHRAHA